MNEIKKCKLYYFPDSFILVIGYIRIYFRLPYRQTEGMIKPLERISFDYQVIHKSVEEKQTNWISQPRGQMIGMIKHNHCNRGPA